MVKNPFVYLLNDLKGQFRCQDLAGLRAKGARPAKSVQWLAYASHGFFHLGHNLFDAEAGWRHARRELIKRIHKLFYQKLPSIRQIEMVNQPVPIGVGSDIGAFEGIGAQIEDLR